MFDLGKECMLYRLHGDCLPEQLRQLPLSAFEDMVVSNELTNDLYVTYTWLDPIRLRDKVVAREKRKVVIKIYREQCVACFFANSESTIAYARNMFMEKLNIPLSKINLFDTWRSKWASDNDWFASLSGIEFKRTPTGSDPSESRTIPTRGLPFTEIQALLDSPDLLSLTFVSRNGTSYFYIDSASAIAFPATSRDDEISCVVKCLVQSNY